MKAKYTKKTMKRRVKKTDRENHSEHYNSFLTCEISKVAVHITRNFGLNVEVEVDV